MLRSHVVKNQLPDDDELIQHNKAIRRGALEGTAIGGVFALGGSYYLQRTFAAYRQMPLSLKALGVVMVVAPAITIQAERRSLEFDRGRWCAEPDFNFRMSCILMS